MSRPEYTFLRDKSFSNWHRTLNNSYYMQDIDTMIWQLYNNKAETIALFEEKSSNKLSIDLNHIQLKALSDLAGFRPVFMLITHHNEDKQYFSFYLISINLAAKQFMQRLKQPERRYLSEEDYVNFEAHLRQEKPNSSIIACKQKDHFPLPEIIE